MSDPDDRPPVDARHGEGVAVGSNFSQYNYFLNGSAGRGGPRRGARRSPDLRVFISSAPGALEPYRMAAVEVCQRLHLTPVLLDQADLQGPAPGQACQEAVDSCDVLVLLLAHRYGPRLPGLNLSQTELEYQCAAGRQLPVLVFAADPDFPWPPSDIDTGAGGAALARFAGQVRSQAAVQGLTGLSRFREDLVVALGRHEVAHGPAEQAQPGGTGQPPPVRAPAFHAVPPYVGSAQFTGRASQLAVLDDWGRAKEPVMVVEAIGGTGKSALTWQWAQDRAPSAVRGLAGRLWWSFYDGSASMTRFMQELLAYTSGRSAAEIQQLSRPELLTRVLLALNDRPYLLVLDGFERLLSAYHVYDPSKLRDEEIEQNRRSMIEPYAEDIIQKLTAAGPSKVLISTRLMPTALQGPFGQQRPGVRHLRLPGLTEADAQTLLRSLGVHGSDEAVAGFFSPLDNHPLLIGVVAGLVSDYRAGPGRFDRWVADPAAGARLNVPDLNLTQRRTHILQAALGGLKPGPRKLLGYISVLPGAARWDTLVAVNPFLPAGDAARNGGGAGKAADPPGAPVQRAVQRVWVAARDGLRQEVLSVTAAPAAPRPESPAPRPDSPARLPQSAAAELAGAHLDAALKELEDRGLLWWNRSSNTYDLHPIIRAHAHDQLGAADRVVANNRVRDHFQALPPEAPGRAASVEDLAQTITILRALIGADEAGEASQLWSRFNSTFMVDLGAYATVAELLAPLAAGGSMAVRASLAVAYNFLGRYDEAASQTAARLADYLREGRTAEAQHCLCTLSATMHAARSYAAAQHCVDLHKAISRRTDGSLYLAQARLAVTSGRTRRARRILRQARRRGAPEGFRWFNENIDYLEAYLALVSGWRHTTGRVGARAPSGLFYRDRAELRADLFLRDGLLDHALAAALDHDQLGRNAGLDVAPARTALILARLGRTSEAAAAVDDALARLTRLHPAQHPYYFLARALRELDRPAEAAIHARSAFEQAWADGPPNCQYWDLKRARDLLAEMGQPIPSLPTLRPAQARIPAEDEIRALIARLPREPELHRLVRPV
jgi:uncharacterized protein DUF4062